MIANDTQNPSDLPLWLSAVDRVLGPVFEAEPTSAELVAYVAGELPPDRRREVASFLLAQPELRAAISAGLAEIAALDAGSDSAGADASAPPLRAQVLRIVAPPWRAAADSAVVEPELLVPEDRQVLYEQAGSLRVVYYRHGSSAFVSLFAGDVAGSEVSASAAVRLDDVELPAVSAEPEVTTFELGPARSILGKRLAVSFVEGGDGGRLELSWLLVEE